MDPVAVYIGVGVFIAGIILLAAVDLYLNW